MSELSKKNIDQNSLIFIFLKVADSFFADNNATQQSIIRGLNNYLKISNFQLSVKQQKQITSATQIVLSDSLMQAQILNLLQSDNQNTEKIFNEILSKFQSYGIFCETF